MSSLRGGKFQRHERATQTAGADHNPSADRFRGPARGKLSGHIGVEDDDHAGTMMAFTAR